MINYKCQSYDISTSASEWDKQWDLIKTAY